MKINYQLFPEIIKYKSTAIMYMATEYEKELMDLRSSWAVEKARNNETGTYRCGNG